MTWTSRKCRRSSHTRTEIDYNINFKLEGLAHSNGVCSNILTAIEEYLLRELGLEGYELRHGHLLETIAHATRQQYHTDFRLNSKCKFVVIPLERGQQIEIDDGGDRQTQYLKRLIKHSLEMHL